MKEATVKNKTGSPRRRKRSVTRREQPNVEPVALRSTQVMLRVTVAEKRLIDRGAANEGDTVSTWLRRLAMQRIKSLGLERAARAAPKRRQ